MAVPSYAALAPIVGRARPLSTLLEWLRRGERLMTVTGSAGIGKTRLAHELLGRVRSLSRENTLFCDLTDARDETDFWLFLSRVFDSECDEAKVLSRAEACGSTLLVLDNFEQLSASSAHAVMRLCGACPKLRVVVTSRSILRVSGEIVMELGPLSLPDSKDDPSSESLELWVSRRARSETRYRPGSEDARALCEILSTLEGIPLAIELAAARAALLGTRELCERLKERFSVLSHGLRGTDERKATLEGAIAWSFQLLSPDELELMLACSVFRGGFSVGDVENVIDRSRLSEPHRILDLVQSLREQSLLRSEAEARLSTFASIREYAEARLCENGQASQVHARHAAWFGRRAEALADAVDGPDGEAALAALDLDRDNLVVAAQRAVQASNASPEWLADAARCLLGLDAVLWTRGPIGAHLELWDGLLSEEARLPRLSPLYACRTLEARGLALSGMGRGAQGLTDVEKAVALAEATGDPILLCRSLLSLSWMHMRVGHLARMQEAVERGLLLCREHGQRRLMGIFIDTSSVVAKEQGDLKRAEALSRQALSVHREVGNRRWEGVALGRLAMLDMERGDFQAAQRNAEAALAIHTALKSRYVEAVLWMTLAVAHYSHGDTERARELMRNALAMYRQVGEQRAYGVAQAYLGAMSFELGEGEAALSDLEQGYETLLSARALRVAAVFAFFLSAFEAHLGRLSRSQSHLEQARAILSEHPDARTALVGELVQAQVALCRAASDPKAHGEMRVHAQGVLARALHPSDAAPVSGESSVDVRLAARMLERALSEHHIPTHPSAELTVHALGHWFARDGGERVALQNRPALRRILVRLASQRVQRPRTALSAEQLVATGWPDEKMSRDSAHNRLYVTLNRLRGLGLRELLVADAGGYYLDPEALIRLSPAGD